MTTRNKSAAPKPGTALPWRVPAADSLGSQTVVMGNVRDMVAFTNTGHSSADAASKNAAYIVAACNAYPQLVDDRRRLIEALRAFVGPQKGRTFMQSADEASALLRSLGEEV